MQFLNLAFQGVASSGTEAESLYNQNVWDSERAVSGAGVENPFEIFSQRGEYIDRPQNGGGLEPWEFGYTEPQSNSSGWLPDWWCDRFPYGAGCGGLEAQRQDGLRPQSGPMSGQGGLFGVEWGSFFLRGVYVVIGIILLGIGAAALASQQNPISRTLNQAQRFIS
jgi:hypothetical protein